MKAEERQVLSARYAGQAMTALRGPAGLLLSVKSRGYTGDVKLAGHDRHLFSFARE
jgi:hypothetical protein